MKYIKKSDAPDFFTEDVKNLTLWSEYSIPKKRKLKKYILEKEQYNLCCYCESKINEDNSHIEHIKPKSIYESETFEYNNLLVSCQGTCHNEKNDSSCHSCGHKKDNKYDETNFLDPTQITDVHDYFTSDQYNLKPTDKDYSKGIYTIDLLNLNDEYNYLSQARKSAVESVEEELFKYCSQFNLSASTSINMLLKNNGLQFISFLRYYFKKVL